MSETNRNENKTSGKTITQSDCTMRMQGGTHAHSHVSPLQVYGAISMAHTILDWSGTSGEQVPPTVAGAMADMICKAASMFDSLEGDTGRSFMCGNIDTVTRILTTAYLENTPVFPMISKTLAGVLQSAMNYISRNAWGGEARSVTAGLDRKPCVCGGLCRKDNPDAEYIGTIDSPEFSEAGIEAIELWRVTDRKENPAVKGGVPVGAPSAFSQALTEHLRQMLKKVGKIGERVDELHAQRQARVPDWRDGASTAEKVSGSARTRGDATGTADQLHGGKPVAEGKPSANIPDTAFGKRIDLYPSADKSSKPAAKAPKPKTPKEDVKPDGTAEVAGFFTPEETGELIEKIRAWLENCRDGHRLSDLMESIRQEFELSDPQLGELLGISDRLVCHVRHGRKSPFALARFTEVFGTAGGAKEG